jgi:hypothetical protein
MLTISEMNTIDRVEADLRAVVQMAVKELAAAGVGLVPSWTGDHVVVAELLLLDVTWDLPARELAEALQPPAIGAIHIDASGTTHRRGTGERTSWLSSDSCPTRTSPSPRDAERCHRRPSRC